MADVSIHLLCEVCYVRQHGRRPDPALPVVSDRCEFCGQEGRCVEDRSDAVR